MAQVLSLQPDEWLQIGLSIVGFGPRHQNCCDRTKLERFQSHFGPKPETLNALFVGLQAENVATNTLS